MITPDFPPGFGGIQLLVHRVVRNVRAFEVRVVTLDADRAREFDADQPFQVRRVRTAHCDRRLAVLRLNAVAMREARAFRPDVLLSAHIVTSLAASGVRIAYRVPVVQYLYADEAIHRLRLAQFALRRAQATIAISDYTRELALSRRADPRRLHLIPPGVDLPGPQRSARASRPTMVTVGRLVDSYKGHDVVIRALPLIRARIPDVEWVVVGDGPLRPRLEALAGELGVAESVRFVGAVSNADRDDWLDRAHVYVMPARLPEGGAGGEGFGIVYLEAGAHGLPVVAGAVGGVRDAIAESVAVLVDPTDGAAVAGAVTDLLLDRSRATRLGEAGRERAGRYAWPRIAEQVERVLLDVTDRG